MIKIFFSAFLLTASVFAKVGTAEMQLIKSVIPGTKIQDADKTPIDGLYIVLLKNKKFLYVYPFDKIILFGEMVTNSGNNISVILKDKLIKENRNNDEEIAEIQSNKKGIEEMKKRALQVMYNNGDDKYALYVFTDPDCPYCKKMEEFFTQANADVSYLFTPIRALHPQSELKSRQIISNDKNITKILDDIRKGKKITLQAKASSQEKLEGMIAVAKMFNFKSTPMILVYDKKEQGVKDIIRGADIPKLKKYIKVRNEK